LLEPAFSAGRKLRAELERYEIEWTLSLDAMPVALMLFDASGKLLHQNRSLHNLLTRWPDLANCQPVAMRLAVDIAQPRRCVRYICNAPLDVVKTVSLRVGQARLSASQSPWPHGDSVCLVSDEFSPRQSQFELTPREADVAALLADGLPDKQIARDLEISLHTVRRHAERVLAKTGCHNQTEAALKLRRAT